MREIKFRAWSSHHNRYADEVDIYHDGSWGFGIQKGSVGYGYTPSKDDKLEQYIGLKDKNGGEIFEGDILKYFDITSDKYMLDTAKTIGVVKYIEGATKYAPQEIEENHKGGNYVAYWDQCTEIEIIGNIHENPELLK
jgi:uncharacterized phage protein (TIGR01671 family)